MWGGLENPLCACVAGTALLTLFVLFVLVVVVVMLQNRQVMVTFFGCCWCSGDTPRVLIVGVPATSGEDRCRRMEGDSGIAMEDVCWDDM